ncbi:riboflavin synthase [Schlesneria paludicola]|uniref:riboflavin synthase n=1 Tax=Schlesneria paludicola TaxID=360056 RepID=UPI00029AC304|nr:riboflavin synthase [Schlesneria paludicola]
MFTGLVECLGRVVSLTEEPGGVRLAIEAPATMRSLAADPGAQNACGDSVAINGCCLTIVAFGQNTWEFQAGQETLSKTNLGALRPGDLVNLERSLPVNGRLGGHFVQGHVDGVGVVDQLDRDAKWIAMGFRIPAPLAELLVPKGSVAVDGVSLTVVLAEPERFTVALIPHTLSVTTLGQRAVGQTVNIETDILGKYARKFMAGFQNV